MTNVLKEQKEFKNNNMLLFSIETGRNFVLKDFKRVCLNGWKNKKNALYLLENVNQTYVSISFILAQ
jgi:hypothetical protein